MPRAAAGRAWVKSHEISLFTRRSQRNTPTTCTTYSTQSGHSPISKLPSELKHMVADLLSQKALYRLARCSTAWVDFAIPKLYARDALFGNSKAIKWAVTTCAKSDPEIALKVLTRSVKYKGDVNTVFTDKGFHATALHYAAAHSSVKLVQELLKLGARVDSWSSGDDFARELGIPALNESLASRYAWLEGYSDEWEWSPLVIPILNNDIEIAELLVHAGAPATIIFRRDEGPLQDSWPVVTVYHMLSAVEPRHAAKWVRVFDHDIYKTMLNVRMHNTRTPLNSAISYENGPVFDMLMDLGADPNIPATFGGTALLTAVRKVFQVDLSTPRRRLVMAWISRLIQAGADVNPSANAHDSPLGCALRLYATTLNTIDPCVKKVIEILVENGADINFRPPLGDTVLQAYCRMMFTFQKIRYPALETMLRYLITNGGDANATRAHEKPSIMFTSIRSILAAEKITSFHAILRDAGARVDAQEAVSVFQHWTRRDWFRKGKAYDISQHAHDVPQGLINRAWTMAINTKDQRLCQALQDSGLKPTNCGQLLYEVIRGGVKEFWPKILDAGFDANYIHQRPHGGSFLHMLVRQVQRRASEDFEPISTNKAVEIAETCIRMGTSSLIRDRDGRLALELLTEDHPKLRHVLLEAYYQETNGTIA